MLKFEGEFSVDITELKAMADAHFKIKRPKYNEMHDYLCRIDDLHKKFLEVFDGKYIKYGPCDWNATLASSNITFKKCYYNYVAFRGCSVTPRRPNAVVDYTALSRNLRVESCEKYDFDYKDSIHLAYHWEDFGVYTRSNCAVQNCFFVQAERGTTNVWEISKEEFDKVYDKSFDLSYLSDGSFRDRWDARKAADEMAKATPAYKALNKQEKLLKNQIRLTKLQRDLICQQQLLDNSRGAVAMDNRDNIPEILEISAKATVDQLNKEITDLKEQLRKGGINVV